MQGRAEPNLNKNLILVEFFFIIRQIYLDENENKRWNILKIIDLWDLLIRNKNICLLIKKSPVGIAIGFMKNLTKEPDMKQNNLIFFLNVYVSPKYFFSQMY